MRNILAPLLLSPLLALAAPEALAAFEPALEQLPPTLNNQTLVEDTAFELLKRQGNACAANYYACNNLNAPGLCCPRTAICSADRNNVVACCPQGAACTGTLGAPSNTLPFVIATTTATTTVPFNGATTSFVQQTNPAGSTVQNLFYPFPIIPTTYPSAAACSSAYTSCQRDAASCTIALANGLQGVTVNAPNGGITITAIPSVGLQNAASICNSLSSQACSLLTVEACAAFGSGSGNAAARQGCGGYWMGAGVAVGVAGQLLT